jgi:hypothetical protein
MSEEEKLPDPQKPGNKIFMTRAYLLPIDKQLFGLYRDVVEEDAETKQREKLGKPIGPIKILRRKTPSDKEESVRVRTVHPKTGESLDLVEWEG